MNTHQHNPFAGIPVQGMSSHPHPTLSTHHHAAFQAAAAAAVQQQQQQQQQHHHHPTYLAHPGNVANGAPPFVLATHVSVPVTVQQAPHNVQVANPSIYKPQASDLKRLSQLMLDASSASPINLAPFDALLLDAEGLMELALNMQAKVVELASTLQRTQRIEASETVADRRPSTGATRNTDLGNLKSSSDEVLSSAPSTASEAQRLQIELASVRSDLRSVLSDFQKSKQLGPKLEKLRQKHSSTKKQLKEALAKNEELKKHIDAVKRQQQQPSSFAPKQSQLEGQVEELTKVSQQNDQLAKYWQRSAHKYKAQLNAEREAQGSRMAALRRKHERALLCQVRASVRSLKAIHQRRQDPNGRTTVAAPLPPTFRVQPTHLAAQSMLNLKPPPPSAVATPEDLAIAKGETARCTEEVTDPNPNSSLRAKNHGQVDDSKIVTAVSISAPNDVAEADSKPPARQVNELGEADSKPPARQDNSHGQVDDSKFVRAASTNGPNNNLGDDDSKPPAEHDYSSLAGL